MPPFAIPTTSAAEELEHLQHLRAERALASLRGDGELLEDIAPPLSATDEELEEPGEDADPYTLDREEGRFTRGSGIPTSGGDR